MIIIMNVLVSDESQLCIDGIEIEEEVIVLSVSSTNLAGLCPLCGTPSDRVHSHYRRHPADLPVAGCSFRLDMNVRRFFCDNDDCEYTIFCERIPCVLAPHARRTSRLVSQQRQVAFALGGEAGTRLLAIMGMGVSPDTLLRLIRKSPEPEVTIPCALGVDDWAKRKGHSYGTILIDLETHQPVDLLPDRSAKSLAEWLKAHPGVEVISRDRGSEYIKGATDGAPDAIQVADRWHLLKNLRESLERLLENKHSCLKAAAEKPKQENSSATHVEQQEKSIEPIVTAEEPLDASPKLTKAEERKLLRRAKRQERYEAVKELHEQGFSKSEISRRLRIDLKTIRKYIRSDTCPMYPEARTRRSKLDPYKGHITQRWQEGCHNATQILHEIRQQGFKGSRSIMMDWVSKTLKPSHSPRSPSSSERVVAWTSRRASWLLMKQEEEFSFEEQQALERMYQVDEKVAEAYTLGQRFVGMIRERQPEALLPWLEDVDQSGIDALKQFAKGIKQDLSAVTNALSLPWSNGQVEGQVNRLKFIKRQMYGRANFDLLRKRVLHIQ